MPEVFILGFIYAHPVYRDLMRAVNERFALHYSGKHSCIMNTGYVSDMELCMVIQCDHVQQGMHMYYTIKGNKATI